MANLRKTALLEIFFFGCCLSRSEHNYVDKARGGSVCFAYCMGNQKLWNNGFLCKVGVLLQNYAKLTLSWCLHRSCIQAKEFTPVEIHT